MLLNDLKALSKATGLKKRSARASSMSFIVEWKSNKPSVNSFAIFLLAKIGSPNGLDARAASASSGILSKTAAIWVTTAVKVLRVPKPSLLSVQKPIELGIDPPLIPLGPTKLVTGFSPKSLSLRS